MKKTLIVTTTICSLLLTPAAVRAQDADGHGNHAHTGEERHHDHDEKKAGPHGGKILTIVEPHAEFFVTKERKVQITFLDEDGKAMDPQEQTVKVICGDRRNPTRLQFTKVGKSLLSDKTLPRGNDFPTVVRIKVTPQAKWVTEKFNLNLNDCPTCDYLEYACTCDHSHDHDHDHGHKH